MRKFCHMPLMLLLNILFHRNTVSQRGTLSEQLRKVSYNCFFCPMNMSEFNQTLQLHKIFQHFTKL